MTKLKDVIIGAVVTLVIGILGTLILNYLGGEEPELWLNDPFYADNHCRIYDMDLEGGYEYEMQLSNRAEKAAFSTLCFYGEGATFKVGDKVYEDEKCYPEYRIRPKSVKLNIEYKPIITVNDTKEGDNFTLIIEASCSHKILSLIRKPCLPLTYTCRYQNKGERFEYIE